jgi:beta-lactam-binding protein with PASTA domain
MINKIVEFVKWHPVLSNAIAIIVTFLVLVWLLGVVFLNIWTGHGNTVEVPLVKGMNIGVAYETLERGGFEVKLDSIYNESMTPGMVVEQSPRSKSIVKEGRTIYLRYICYSPRLVKVPYYENMSRRGIEVALDKAGLKNWVIKEVPNENVDLVLAVKYNGQRLKAGMEIPANARVIIEVGASMGGGEGYGDFSEELILPEGTDSISYDMPEEEYGNYND